MATLTSADVVRIADRVIHDIGAAFVMDPWTMSRGEELGHDNGMNFYFAGRGGVLGDVDADVVAAAMGWFHPAVVRSMWEPGVAVAGAREAARLHFEACAEWGREHLAVVDGVERFAALAERLVDAADASALPLFAGWRAQPRSADVTARAMQLIHVLRELRGGIHLVATTAVGLPPAAAVVMTDGPDYASTFGWADLPDCSQLATRHAEAQASTDRLCAAVYERAFDDEEQQEFADLTTAIGAAVL